MLCALRILNFWYRLCWRHLRAEAKLILSTLVRVKILSRLAKLPQAL